MMRDLISRQAAIDLLRKRLIETANNNVGFPCDAGQVFEDASERIKYWIDELPSAQPDIIRCNECVYADKYFHCDYMTTWNNGDCFCSHAERGK